MKIGICGSTVSDENTRQLAAKLGEAIGQKKHDVLIGTGAAVPYLVAKAAHDIGSKVIAYSPLQEQVHLANELRGNPDPSGVISAIVYLPDAVADYISEVQTKMRNMIMVGDMDAAVFIAGQWGTTTEFGMARSLDIPVALVKGSGEAADALPHYVQSIEGPDSKKLPVVYSNDPEDIVRQLECFCDQGTV